MYSMVNRKVNQLGGDYDNGRALPLHKRNLILEMAAKGIKPSDISKSLMITHGTVSKLLNLYEATGSVQPRSATVRGTMSPSEMAAASFPKGSESTSSLVGSWASSSDLKKMRALVINRKHRKPRTLFTSEQLAVLESYFEKQCYPSDFEHEHIGVKTGLAKAKVQTWFSNKRAKLRKESARGDRQQELQQLQKPQPVHLIKSEPIKRAHEPHQAQTTHPAVVSQQVADPGEQPDQLQHAPKQALQDRVQLLHALPQAVRRPRKILPADSAQRVLEPGKQLQLDQQQHAPKQAVQDRVQLLHALPQAVRQPRIIHPKNAAQQVLEPGKQLQPDQQQHAPKQAVQDRVQLLHALPQAVRQPKIIHPKNAAQQVAKQGEQLQPDQRHHAPKKTAQEQVQQVHAQPQTGHQPEAIHPADAAQQVKEQADHLQPDQIPDAQPEAVHQPEPVQRAHEKKLTGQPSQRTKQKVNPAPTVQQAQETETLLQAEQHRTGPSSYQRDLTSPPHFNSSNSFHDSSSSSGYKSVQYHPHADQQDPRQHYPQQHHHHHHHHYHRHHHEQHYHYYHRHQHYHQHDYQQHYHHHHHYAQHQSASNYNSFRPSAS